MFERPTKKRLPWLLGALALMFGSAYSILRFFVAVDAVSNWIGLPQYAGQIPKIEAEGMRWGKLGVVLPFVAAFLLGFGRDEADARLGSVEPSGRSIVTYSAKSHEWIASIGSYSLRLAVSGLGTLGFVVLLLLFLFVRYKLNV
jgi:hypothetical protein